jgi:hypothetical protein
MQLIAHILSGRSFNMSTKLQAAFNRAYTSVYGGFNPDLAYGQELIYASEILSRATDIRTQRAKDVVRRLLKALDV